MMKAESGRTLSGRACANTGCTGAATASAAASRIESRADVFIRESALRVTALALQASARRVGRGPDPVGA